MSNFTSSAANSSSTVNPTSLLRSNEAAGLAALSNAQQLEDVLVAGLRPGDVLRHSLGNSLKLLQGEFIDVNGRQAPGEDLRGWNWKQIRSAIGANFASSNFEGVRFSRAISNKFDFSQAILSEARFTNVIFPSSGTRFVNANLRNALFLGASLREADFTGANLRNAFFNSFNNIRPADLRGARFDRTALRETDFTNAKLVRAYFTACTGYHLTQEHERPFNGTKLDKADLRGATFYKQDMSFFSLNGADIRGADFSDATNMAAIKTASGVVYSPAGSKYPTRFPKDFTPPSHWIARPLVNY